MDWGKFSEYGLLGLVIGAVIVLLFFIVKWVLEHVKALLEQQAKEREAWCKVQEKQNETFQKVVVSIDQVVKALEKHDEKADERGKYVREEHKEMIASLGRINGYKS